jgi:hypothetical protein
MRFLLGTLLFLTCTFSFGKQVNVKGYYKSNGTYVAPHVRSSPDSNKWNNYGSSKSAPSYGGSSGYSNPYNRDSDRDGISNQFDTDDDNDGIHDDYDR